MARDDFSDFPWIRPWQAISLRGRVAYEYELSLEVTPGHPLEGVHATALGRRCIGDDVLFRLHNHSAEYAVVHLTYSGRSEIGPQWPAVVLYANLDHWIMRGMLIDAADWETDQSSSAA
jgi:hypothetical protein